MGRVKRIWYLSPMQAAEVQASQIPSPAEWLGMHSHDGMLEDTNWLDGAQMLIYFIAYKISMFWKSLSGLIIFSRLSRDMTKPTKWVCTRQRLRSAWASSQSDQSLCCPHEESLGP